MEKGARGVERQEELSHLEILYQASLSHIIITSTESLPQGRIKGSDAVKWLQRRVTLWIWVKDLSQRAERKLFGALVIALGDFLRMLLFYGINLSHMDLELSDLEKKYALFSKDATGNFVF